MDDQNTLHDQARTITEAEQMYLLTTAQLVDGGLSEPVPLAALAEALAVQPVSANQMVHNLEAAGLLAYQPYKGVALTPAGQAHARRVLRYRTLWQSFLTAHLHLDPVEAEAIACEFEHATTEAAADRLEAFLANLSGGPAASIKPVPLCEVTPGQPITLQKLPNEPAMRRFLEAQSLTVGSLLEVLARGEQGELLVRTPSGTIQLSENVASTTLVVPMADQPNLE